MNSDIEFLKERFRKLATPLDPVPTDTKPVLKKISGIRFHDVRFLWNTVYVWCRGYRYR
jgi:hypothetical protein